MARLRDPRLKPWDTWKQGADVWGVSVNARLQPMSRKEDMGHPVLWLRLAVDHLERDGGVTVADDLFRRESGFELGGLGGRQLDVGGCRVLFEVFAALRSWDGNRSSPFDNTHASASWPAFTPLRGGDGFHAFDELLVFVEGFDSEARVTLGAGIFLAQVAELVDRSGEEAAAERAVGDESDAEFAYGGEDFGFHVALPEGVFGLEGSDGMDSWARRMVAGDASDRPRYLTLPASYELGHGSDGVLDRGFGVDAVLVVEVDVVNAEALEGGVAGGVDVFGFAADGPVGGIILFPDVGEFGG